MLKRISILLVAVLLFSAQAYAKEIAGIIMPATVAGDSTTLVLNGAGVRTKLFIKTYAAGLYLVQKNSDPRKILAAEEAMAIRLHIVSSLITAEKMEEAVREGFDKSAGSDTARIKPQIEKFISVFKEKINENDVYDFIYSPTKGVEIYKNSRLFEVISGPAFKQALFGIWLSDNPVQKSLKEEMLGK
jgi:hypothetical protein